MIKNENSTMYKSASNYLKFSLIIGMDKTRAGQVKFFLTLKVKLPN